MTDLTFIEGTVGKVFTFTLVGSDGDAFDLTSATVTLLVDGQSARTCTVTSAAEGICTYTTVSGDNATDGTGWRADGGSGTNKDGLYEYRIKAVNGATYTYFSDPKASLRVTRA
jgi:hypothetical protein